MSNPLLGAVAGAAGGLAGSWAMVRFQHAIKPNGWDGDGGHHQHRRQNALPNDTDGTLPDEPASMQVASAVANAVTGHPLDEPTKQVTGSVVHYAFGALVGALYGAAAETRPATTAGAGAPLGAAVWLAAVEIGVPLAGFSSKPTDYPVSRHAAAFASHLVFGVTVEAVRRVFRGTRRK